MNFSIKNNVFAEPELSKNTMRFRAIQRIMLWNYLSGRIPLYLVSEFPKSGATWYSKMLSECIDVPFPKSLSKPKLQKMILRDTKLYSSKYKNISVVMRDGRDIMISSYYHFLFPNEVNLQFGIDEKRKILGFKDYEDIEHNLPKFIEYMFEIYPTQGWGTRFNWAQFVDSWADKNTPIVKYEDLLQSPEEEMKRMVFELTGTVLSDDKASAVVSKYSFKNITGRKQGEFAKNSFARKGIAGDWKNHFNNQSVKIFKQYASNQLIKMAYETDDSWTV
ncbi:MAG: sulfotransferase domain-containing protein [Nitratireductor sp.]